jgi:hypothetical protein
MSIPVIGTAIVANPHWLNRLIMSVDYPVDNFVIINNNGRGELNTELDNLTKITHKYIKKITVCHMPANVGCAGAWNLIIKCYMNAPYWIIVNDDVSFCPGLLQEMAGYMETDPDLGMIHPNKGDYELGAWDLFVIRDRIVQLFGLFDENTYPAYNEDADYIMRMRHRPIKKIVGTLHQYYHGDKLCTQYYESGSQTQVSEPHLKTMLDEVNDKNIEYMTKKWGADWRVCNPTTHPYNKTDIPIDYSTYDLEFVRSKHLGF